MPSTELPDSPPGPMALGPGDPPRRAPEPRLGSAALRRSCAPCATTGEARLRGLRGDRLVHRDLRRPLPPPKEDEFLFHALRNRTRHADGFLRDLQQEHAAGRPTGRAQGGAPSDQRGGVTEIQDFAVRLDRYVRGQEEHLRREEDIVIPIARQLLTAADWEGIERAFHANRDPFFGIGAAGPIASLIPRAVGPT